MKATVVPSRPFALVLAAAWLVAAGAVRTALAQSGMQAPKYPATPRGSQVDEISGVRVPDPYQWLEAITSSDVRAWVNEENAVTEQFLSHEPRRREIQGLVTKAWDYSDIGTPFGGGERLFYTERARGVNQPELFVQDKAALPPRVLLDPNSFSTDGLISIATTAASPDGKYLAYAVSTQGSDWLAVHVRDVRTSQDVEDLLKGIREPTLLWTRDERGFFYVRSDAGRAAANPVAPDGRQQLFYHRVGHSQADDALVFDDPQHPAWRIRPSLSEDGEYLVIAVSAGVQPENRLYFIDLDNPKRPNLRAPLVRLFDAADAAYDFVANEGPVFFIRTTKDAPRGRLVGVDINTPDEDHWVTSVRETYDPLIAVERVDNRLVAHRLHDAHSVLEVYGLDGTARGLIALPGFGTVTDLRGRSDYRELYFRYSSILQHPAVYKYDLETKAVTVFGDSADDSGLAKYETTELYYTSDDGTRIPMSITARRGMTLDRSHPALLSAIGAFGASATPVYSPRIAAWLDLGGIYAVANVRGGGEYGRAWHQAATRATKQVAIDDYLAAARFLADQRYTRPQLLAADGHGAGATLAAAAVIERPELFGAALLDAGAYDMARFDHFGLGATWTPEFGSPERTADLRALMAYSPLQNVRSGTRYPGMLISDGEHDDVVTPVQSFKFAAALQAATNGNAPELLRLDVDTGFGPGASLSQSIALASDQLTFLIAVLPAPH